MTSAMHAPVRVRDPETGDHLTTTRALAKRAGYQVLEGKPAVNPYSGRWLPRKRKQSAKAAEKTTTPSKPTQGTKPPRVKNPTSVPDQVTDPTTTEGD